MKKLLKRLALVLLAAVVVIQFIRPARNMSGPGDHPITASFPVPAAVEQIIKTSCYDCHSNSTRYPWYAEVQPVGWWLAGHIKDARAELNFDEFAERRPRWQYKKFTEVEEQVSKDEMPLPSYTILHRDAILSPEQKTLLVEWTLAMRDSMKARYPVDSLKGRQRAP
jgi:hypothetical protein